MVCHCRSHSRSLKMTPFDRSRTCTCPFWRPIVTMALSFLYHLRETARCWSKLAIFFIAFLHSMPHLRGPRLVRVFLNSVDIHSCTGGRCAVDHWRWSGLTLQLLLFAPISVLAHAPNFNPVRKCLSEALYSLTNIWWKFFSNKSHHCDSTDVHFTLLLKESTVNE